VDDHLDISMPEAAIRQQDFVDWSERLPEKQTPSWLGLPNNAEKLLLTNIGTLNTCVNIWIYQTFSKKGWTEILKHNNVFGLTKWRQFSRKCTDTLIFNNYFQAEVCKGLKSVCRNVVFISRENWRLYPF